MSNAIIMKKTGVAGRIPAVEQLEPNEVGYNEADGRLFIRRVRDGETIIQQIGGVTSVQGYSYDVALNTDDMPEGESNLYFTESRARASITGGTGVYYNSESGIVSIGQPVAVYDSVTFENMTLNGDLTVRGTTTTVNSETVTIADNIIQLNSNVTGAPNENAGLEIERGTSANVQFRWNETGDYWDYTEDGSTYHRVPKIYAGDNISFDPNTGIISVVTENLDADTLDGQNSDYYLNWNNFTDIPPLSDFYTFPTDGSDSYAPTFFPANTISGFSAFNSTDFPGNYYVGVTAVANDNIGAQLAMGWNSEEESPEQMYFRVNDSTSNTTSWGDWQRIAIGQPVRETDTPTFSQITVTEPPTSLNQIATIQDLISVPGDLAITAIGSIDIQLTNSNAYAGSVDEAGTPSYISNLSGASIVGNASGIGTNYTVMEATYTGSAFAYTRTVSFRIDIAAACGLEDAKYAPGTTEINSRWKGNYRINAFSALFKMRELNFWDYTGGNATWEYSINMIPVTTDPENASYGKFTVSSTVWAIKSYHAANLGARWLGTATKYRNLI